MERPFSRSELGKRDKWTGRPHYRERSIRNALGQVQGGYEPPESAIAGLLKLIRPVEYIHAVGGDLFASIDGIATSEVTGRAAAAKSSSASMSTCSLGVTNRLAFGQDGLEGLQVLRMVLSQVVTLGRPRQDLGYVDGQLQEVRHRDPECST